MRGFAFCVLLVGCSFAVGIKGNGAALANGKGTPTRDKNPKSVDKPPSNPRTGTGQQQQNLAKLKSDLEAIHGKSQVTQQQKQAVAQDLYAILAVANKPSQASVQALANDLTRFLADGKLSTMEAMKLTQDAAAVLSSANISQQAAQKLTADVQTLLKATNLSQQDMQTLQQDLQAIVKTAQQNSRKKPSTLCRLRPSFLPSQISRDCTNSNEPKAQATAQK